MRFPKINMSVPTKAYREEHKYKSAINMYAHRQGAREERSKRRQNGKQIKTNTES